MRDRLTQAGVWLATVVLVGLLWAYLAHLFHVDGLSVPPAGIGSWADPYFINFLLEFWRHAAITGSDPASPPIFYPASGTLGYSHSLILYAPVYLAARAVLDPFPAETVTLLAVCAIGLVALFVLLRRYIRAGYWLSVVLTALVATSPNVINTGTEAWVQRLSCYFIPLILWVGAYGLGMRAGWVRTAIGVVFGFAVVSLLTQDIYTGLLFSWVACLLVAGGFAAERPRTVRHLWQTATRHSMPRRWRPSRAWLIVAVLFLLMSVAIALWPVERTSIRGWRFSATDPMPHLRIAALAGAWYVLRLMSGPGVRRAWRAIRRSAEVLGRSLAARLHRRPPDRPDVRPGRRPSWWHGVAAGALAGATVFFWIYARAAFEYHGFPPEQIHANLIGVDPARWRNPVAIVRDLFVYDSVRPFALVAGAVALAWLPVFRVPAWLRRFGLVALGLSLLVCIVAIRLEDFSIWIAVTAIVPGTSIVRDPKRVIYIYELVAAGMAALIVTGARARRALFTTLVLAGCLAMLVIDRPGRTFRFDRSAAVYEAWVTRPIAIDPSCQSFFVLPASDAYRTRSDEAWPLYGTDSAFVSLRVGLPTLNGYSAWTPRDWNLVDPHEPGYFAEVRGWIDRRRLTGVCAFDIEARTMTPFR